MPSSIYVKLGAGLGNQLFQLSLSYILAKRSGRRVYASNSRELPVHHLFEPIPANVDLADAVILDGHVVRQSQIDEVVAGDKDIVLVGYFQRFSYYDGFRQELSDLVSMLIPEGGIGGSDNDIVFHVRTGDYRNSVVQQNYMMPTSLGFFEHAFRARSWENSFIVTDDALDPLVEELASLTDGHIVSHDQSSDFNFIRNSKNIVLSSSTFSWWAAWLSQANSIYSPRLGNWNPLLRPDVDLRVTESRYTHSSAVSVLKNFFNTTPSLRLPKKQQLRAYFELKRAQSRGEIFSGKR